MIYIYYDAQNLPSQPRLRHAAVLVDPSHTAIYTVLLIIGGPAHLHPCLEEVHCAIINFYARTQIHALIVYATLPRWFVLLIALVLYLLPLQLPVDDLWPYEVVVIIFCLLEILEAASRSLHEG